MPSKAQSVVCFRRTLVEYIFRSGEELRWMNTGYSGSGLHVARNRRPIDQFCFLPPVIAWSVPAEQHRSGHGRSSDPAARRREFIFGSAMSTGWPRSESSVNRIDSRAGMPTESSLRNDWPASFRTSPVEPGWRPKGGVRTPCTDSRYCVRPPARNSFKQVDACGQAGNIVPGVDSVLP